MFVVILENSLAEIKWDQLRCQIAAIQALDDGVVPVDLARQPANVLHQLRLGHRILALRRTLLRIGIGFGPRRNRAVGPNDSKRDRLGLYAEVLPPARIRAAV